MISYGQLISPSVAGQVNSVGEVRRVYPSVAGQSPTGGVLIGAERLRGSQRLKAVHKPLYMMIIFMGFLEESNSGLSQSLVLEDPWGGASHTRSAVTHLAKVLVSAARAWSSPSAGCWDLDRCLQPFSIRCVPPLAGSLVCC